MIVRIDEPERQVILRLREHGADISLTGQIAGSDDEQEIFRFTVGGIPTQGDPLGQKTDTLRIATRKLRDHFPVETDGHGHAVVRMDA